MIEIAETDSPKYPPRTFLNARHTDATLAVAVDFSTAGEKLTEKAAGVKILQVNPAHPPLACSKALWKHLEKLGGNSLNIAGNGIYTFAKHGWTQEDINSYIFQAIKELHRVRPIALIRTGGQTGADWGGAVAAVALGIPSIITYPKGFIRKFANGETVRSSKDRILSELQKDADNVLAKHGEEKIARKRVAP